jgi:hypothetical protein
MESGSTRLTPAQIKQAEQTAAAIFVTAYLVTRSLEFVFGRLAVGAKFVRQGMEKAAQGIAENNARGQLPPRTA